jgi:hypothetical protein
VGPNEVWVSKVPLNYKDFYLSLSLKKLLNWWCKTIWYQFAYWVVEDHFFITNSWIKNPKYIKFIETCSNVSYWFSRRWMMFFYVNFYEKIKLKKQLIEHLQFIIQMFSHKLFIMHNFPFGETSRNWKKK